MKNEEKIEKMLKFFHGSRTLKDLLLEMAEWKDAQLREQEKRLLDVFEMVLNLSARTQEGYDFAMSLFRDELINQDI